MILGIIGTFLIFFTEVGYSYRKRRIIRSGTIGGWLSAHILLGIVGPLIIIWHTGLNFYGFGGGLTALLAVVVASGFIGRYIYMQIPRSIRGQEATLKEISDQKSALDGKLDALMVESSEAAEIIEAANREIGAICLPGEKGSGKSRGLRELLYSSIRSALCRQRLHRIFAGRNKIEHRILRNIKTTELEQLALQRRIDLLDTSKILLSKWRIFHKPLTMILLVGIFLHIANVFYYGKIWP